MTFQRLIMGGRGTTVKTKTIAVIKIAEEIGIMTDRTLKCA